MSSELSDLQARLGGADVTALQALSSADLARFSGLIEHACEHQTETLKQASEQALKHIPALLRPAVRKLLF